MGGGFFNNGKLTKPLKSLVNTNGILEYDTKRAQLDAPYVEFFQSQALVLLNRIGYDAAEKTKRGVGCSVWD